MRDDLDHFHFFIFFVGGYLIKNGDLVVDFHFDILLTVVMNLQNIFVRFLLGETCHKPKLI